ncbi:uncharacterized protein LOC127877770 [Dreissena polymorpha]|uniref:Uncharacterized protein n=1 Tax=Dreissena polymorpha TaxID=45954 RepID=A0A9D4KHV9_DREPO|nr:uncharacterized protein LOC127877770 [Dreissena polymorpha]KAH3839411.1 hypothetical protein DPMN_112841 [Dreissena polymorpha]
MFSGRNEKPTVALFWLLVASIIFLGLVLHIVGFSTNEWIKADTISMGLWRACSDSACFSMDSIPLNDWMKAVQAMASLGVIHGFIALVMVLTVLVSPRRFHLLKGVCVCSTLAGCVVLIGIIVYGAESETDSLGYSFGLSCAGGSLMLIAGVMLILNMCTTSNSRPQIYGVQYPMTGKPIYEPSYPQELHAGVVLDNKPNIYPDDRMSRVSERPTWNERFDRFERRNRSVDDFGARKDRYENFDRMANRLYQSGRFDASPYVDDRFRREDALRRYESLSYYPRPDKRIAEQSPRLNERYEPFQRPNDRFELQPGPVDRFEPPPRFHGQNDLPRGIESRYDQPRTDGLIYSPLRSEQAPRNVDRSAELPQLYNGRYVPPSRYDEMPRQVDRLDDLPRRYDQVASSQYRYDRY